jgi:hypothetical protein
LRGRQALALVVPSVRALSWSPLAGAAVLSLVAAQLARLVAGHPGQPLAVLVLRLAAVALGAGGSFAMVDRMGALTVPTPRWLRQWIRVGLVVLPMAAGWVAIAAFLHADLSAGLAGEAVACAGVGLAAAAVAGRHRHTASAALAGAVTQFVLLVGTLFAPERYSPWAPPGNPHWSTVHRWWWGAAAATALALLLANRDPWPVARLGRGAVRAAGQVRV